MEQIKTVTSQLSTRPMQSTIELAQHYGFKRDNNQPIWETIEQVKYWLYDKYSIWIWTQPRTDGTFIPYYRDMRYTYNQKKKLNKVDHPQEAITNALYVAMGVIEKIVKQ